MRLSKWTAYITGLFLLTTPFVVYKITWLCGTKTTKAVVSPVEKAFSIDDPQTYPVYRYTIGNREYHKSGNSNMPFKAGHSVVLRYKVKNPLKARLNTF